MNKETAQTISGTYTPLNNKMPPPVKKKHEGKPVVGELVVVSHWGDFDYPWDAVQLGILRETQEHNGRTYYYVDDSYRGFRYCRTLTPRVLPDAELDLTINLPEITKETS